MKCVICKGENIRKQDVEEEIRIGNDVVFVPAKVMVCKECGERYYSRKVMKELEKIEENVRKRNIFLKEIGRVLSPTVVKN